MAMISPTGRTLARRMDAASSGKTLPELDRPRERAWRQWAIAQAQLAKGNRAQAEDAARKMQNAMAHFKGQVKPLVVAQLELKAHLAGNAGKKIQLLERAARDERALRYTEPTSYPRPVLEVLGQVALKAGKAQIAERAFRDALEQYPESAGAKAGLRAALRSQNRPVEAGLD